MKRHWLTVVIACFSLLANAAETPAEKLPVRRVVLYKNGVGYFEHTGRIHGDQELKIDFTSSQLNDVLKSLTVLDLNGGKITGVGYNSVAPVAEQLKSLRVPLGQTTTLENFLAALRGAQVEAHGANGVISGRILTVEAKTVKKAQEESQSIEVSLITDNGELRTFPLTPSSGLRIADRDLSAEVSRYLNLMGAARDQDTRRMTIATSGSGDREIFVSYISEVPVWKSTYRILLPTKSDSKPRLQGWAIVDNTVGEDWSNVELSLVAGAPQSFVQDLSRPYYTRRPAVGMPEAAMLTPQTHEGTIADLVSSFTPGVSAGVTTKSGTNSFNGVAQGQGSGIGAGSGGGFGGGTSNYKVSVPNAPRISGTVRDVSGAAVGNAQITARNSSSGQAWVATSDSNGYFSLPVTAGTYQVELHSPGFRAVRQTVQVSGTESRDLSYRLEVGSAASTVEVAGASPVEDGANSGSIIDLEEKSDNSELSAAAQDLGDLFEYNLKEKVTILKNHSALVPIINAHIDAEKVTLWNGSSGKPLRALWITNSSGLTLDSGTFNIIENNAFAGEGLIEPLKPGEKRLLSYAVDQGVRVQAKNEFEWRPVTHVKIDKGVLVETRERRDSQTYTVHNSDSDEREVVIEHPVRSGWKLAGNLKPDETSASFYRFRVKVKPGGSASLKVDEVQSMESTVALSTVTDDQIKLLFKDKTSNPELEEALRRILRQKDRLAGFDQQIQTRQTELNSITQDQQRLRENMKALKGSAEEKALLQRYTRELNDQEDKLQAVRGEVARLELSRAESRQQLDTMLEEIKLDAEI